MTSSTCPVPLVGETLFSILARMYLRGAYKSPSHMFTRLGIKNNRFLASPLGGMFLGRLFQVFPQLESVLTPEQTVMRHTTSPLQIAFSLKCNDVVRREEFVRRVAAHGGWMGGPRASQQLCPDGMRFCPQCCEQDCLDTGIPYWHREHQVKMVTRCWKHDTRLREVRLASGVGYAFDVPSVKNREDDSDELRIADPDRPGLASRIAAAVADILNASMWAEPDRLRQTLLRAAAAKGVVYNSRASRDRIWSLIQKTYGPDYLNALELPTEYSQGVANRFVEPFRIGKSNLNVTIVVLLVVALEIDPQQIVGDAVNPDMTASGLRRDSHCGDRASNPQTLALENALASNQYILQRTAAALKISRHKLIKMIVDAGISCPIVQGPNAKRSESEIRQMMELFRRGAPRELIQNQFRCNPSFIDQLAVYDSSLRRDATIVRQEHVKQRNRQALLQFIEKTPEVTRAMLYEKLPGPISLLTRHDKLWLREVVDKLPIQPGEPPLRHVGRGRVCDEEFDQSVRQKIQTAWERAIQMAPPPRVTRSLLFRLAALRLGAHIKLTSGRMPQTEAFLKQVTESDRSFAHRKLRYAFERLAATRNTVTATSLRLASGFTPPQLRMHREFIHQVAAEKGMPFSSKVASWMA